MRECVGGSVEEAATCKHGGAEGNGCRGVDIEGLTPISKTPLIQCKKTVLWLGSKQSEIKANKLIASCKLAKTHSGKTSYKEWKQLSTIASSNSINGQLHSSSIFLSNANEIVPGIWLGNNVASKAIPSSNHYNILSIIQLSSTAQKNINKLDPFFQKINYIRAPIVNVKNYPIIWCLPECVDAINKLMESRLDYSCENENKISVLCTCETGNDASAAVIAAYLMAKKSLSIEDSYSIIKNVRPTVNDNKFKKQLKLWEALNYTLDNYHKEHIQDLNRLPKLRNYVQHIFSNK